MRLHWLSIVSLFVGIIGAPEALAQKSCGTRECTTTTGRCGSQTCFVSCIRVGGVLECDDNWGTCVEKSETCNNVDDNCDGQKDEGVPDQPCPDCGAGGTKKCVNGTYGACKLTTSCTVCGETDGSKTCTDGSWAPCVRAESCNGCDDDNDQVPDDNLFCPVCPVET